MNDRAVRIGGGAAAVIFVDVGEDRNRDEVLLFFVGRSALESASLIPPTLLPLAPPLRELISENPPPLLLLAPFELGVGILTYRLYGIELLWCTIILYEDSPTHTVS